jgi:acetyl esterase/lipase
VRSAAAGRGFHADEIRGRLLQLAARRQAEVKLTTLRSRLEKNPGDADARRQLILTLLFELDATPERRQQFAFTLQFFYNLVGGSLEEHRNLAMQASPLSHVSGNEPPFLIVTGDADNLMPPEQSEALVEALRRAGSDVTYHLVPGGGHIFWGAGIDQLVLAFFNRHLKG